MKPLWHWEGRIIPRHRPNLRLTKNSTGELSKTSSADVKRIILMKKNPQTIVWQIRNTLQESGVDLSMTTVHTILHEQKCRGYTARCKPLLSRKNWIVKLQCGRKYLKEQPQLVLGLVDNETMRWKLTYIRVVAREKYGGQKELPKIQSKPPHLWNKWWGVMAWACMAAEGTGPLIFIDDITDDGSSTPKTSVN